MIALTVRDWVAQQPVLYRRACRTFGYTAVAGIIRNRSVDDLVTLAKARQDPISSKTLYRQLPMLEWYGLVRRERNAYVDDYGRTLQTANTYYVDYSKVIPADHIAANEVSKLVAEAALDPIGTWIAANPSIAESIAKLHEREANQPAEPPF